MKHFLKLVAILFLVLGLIGVLVFLYYQDQQEKELAQIEEEKAAKEPQDEDPFESLGILELQSIAFDDNFSIPEKHTCDGENINPPFRLLNVPDDAKSLALIIDDPDAPGGSFTHWTLWNIPTDTREISENSIPNGAHQGLTSFGENQYNGPCPPSGQHSYLFKLYALDSLLDLPNDTRVEDLEDAIEDHIVAETVLTGKYKRK